MLRSLKGGAVAMAVGAFIAAAPTARAAVMPAASADALGKTIAPMPSANDAPQSATQMLHLAQRRGGYRGYRGRGYRGRGYGGGPYYYGGRYRRGGSWVGPAIGVGIAAIIIGGAIAASKDRYRDRWDRCDDEFRTFRWSDGTYIPYAGSPRVLCPYLRG